jgi:hypothetical protein
MLGFAGNSAGVAADTFAIIDDEAEIHFLAPESLERSPAWAAAFC